MLPEDVVGELDRAWLPHITDAGLDRLVDLLERASPLLVHGCFVKAVPMGCLATHVAWNHPGTAHLTQEAGITWLARVACLNPATSLLIREWDRRGIHDLELRADLLAAFRAEKARRHEAGKKTPARRAVVRV